MWEFAGDIGQGNPGLFPPQPFINGKPLDIPIPRPGGGGIATCEDLIMRFDKLDPETLVDDALTELDDRGMVRPGDVERAQALREWFLWRQDGVAAELERFRYLPDPFGNCPDGLELCGDQACGTPKQCETRRCSPSQDFCDTLQRCIEREWESCPTCDEEGAPFYCELNFTCVADAETCMAVCQPDLGQEYCEPYRACVPIGQCELEF
jgi:hypothetical protein